MISKREIRKNCLDLEFKAESQKAILYLTLGTITVLGFLTGMIVRGLYFIGGISAFLIFLLSMMLFRNAQKRMKHIIAIIEAL